MKIITIAIILVVFISSCAQKDKSVQIKTDELIRIGRVGTGAGGTIEIDYLNQNNQLCYVELLCNGKVIKDEDANKARYSMVIYACNFQSIGKESPHLCGVEEIKKIKNKLEYWLYVHIDQYKIEDPLEFYTAMADKGFPPDSFHSSYYNIMVEARWVKKIIEQLDEGLEFRKKVGNKFVEDIQSEYWKEIKRSKEKSATESELNGKEK